MTYDIWVDFQRMADDGRLLARARNARPDLVILAGNYLVVGCEDADPAVAQVMSVTADGALDLRVLPGTVQDHARLLHRTG